jgi:hypothetical protein
VCSPEDVDTAMVEGLAPRYSFMGIFEVMHLNAEGMFLKLNDFYNVNTFVYIYGLHSQIRLLLALMMFVGLINTFYSN